MKKAEKERLKGLEELEKKEKRKKDKEGKKKCAGQPFLCIVSVLLFLLLH